MFNLFKKPFDIKDISNKNITVIGDVFLDVYYECTVERISAEAPVLIAKTEDYKKVCRLGGAGNVAANLADLGAKVTFICGFANDAAGKIINTLCEDKNIEVINNPSKYPTIKKIRYHSNNQQILRVDKERGDNCTPFNKQTKININADLVVISDYCKGTFNPENSKHIINFFNASNLPTFVDSKDKNFKFKGATCFTPNHKEMMNLTSSSNRLNSFIRENNLDYVCVTEGKRGISYWNKSGSVYNSPAVAKDVYDVSGAGDTVLAILALLYNNKCDFRKSIDIANIAAGIAIQKFGTDTVTRDELNIEINNYLKINKTFNYERN